MAIADPTRARGATPDLLDARGYPRGGGNIPGHHRGRPPANKGLDLGPTPPTVDEIVACCQQCPDTPAGRRTRALIIVLWRTGMRIGCEALRLTENDLDQDRGTIHIRRGKGGKRRTVPMDPWAWREIAPWLLERRNYPAGPLFCCVEGPTRGVRAVNQHDVNKQFRRLERQAGLRRRFAPHQLRHSWTLENLRGDMPAHVLMRILGHANLKVTTTYVHGLDEDEMFDWVRNRPAPVMAVPRLLSTTHEPSTPSRC